MNAAAARATIACASVANVEVADGEGRYVGDAWVWDHDRVWAALLSLPTAAAAAAVFGRLDLADGPRSAAANRALACSSGVPLPPASSQPVVSQTKRNPAGVPTASTVVRNSGVGAAITPSARARLATIASAPSP